MVEGNLRQVFVRYTSNIEKVSSCLWLLSGDYDKTLYIFTLQSFQKGYTMNILYVRNTKVKFFIRMLNRFSILFLEFYQCLIYVAFHFLMIN